ncbi:hypothetical protein KR054_004771 [Drosophila jambulina]|nr:hypothetical protein KR054_004771 [Drosophila jambulina]
MALPYGPQSPDIDVLIVGAGLSGLASALKILTIESSMKLRIIEASDELGGQLGENGVRFVDREQLEMLSVLASVEMMPRRRSRNSGSLSRCWDLDQGLTSVPAKFELERYINMLELRMSKFRSKIFSPRERVSNMELHICQHLFFNKSRNFMLNLVEVVCGVPANEVVYDVFMSLCSSCGGLKMIIDFYFTYPSNFYEVSTKTLIDKILDQIPFTAITLNSRAVKLEHFKNYVQVTDAEGIKHTAQAVILAIPWNKVQKLQFDPSIPEDFLPPVAPKAGQTPLRQITQFRLRYDRSPWTELGYSGNFLSSEPLISAHECGKSTIDGYMLHLPEDKEDVMGVVLDQLADQFGEEMRQPRECRCCTDELNVVLHKPQVRPWFRIIWSSSSAVGTTYRSLIGGAVESGVRAAVNALFVVRPQMVSWKDMPEERKKSRQEESDTGRLRGLLSRFNLYNVTFYSLFVVGTIGLLNFGYERLS